MALKQRERLLLVSLAVVGGALLLYSYVHGPLTARRAEARERLQTVETDLTQQKKRLAKEGDLAARRAAVTGREQMIDAWVPGKNSAALLIWHLSQAEQISGGRIKSIQVGEKKLVQVADETAKGAGASAKGATGGGAGAAEPLTATLMLVPLEMKVEGRFAEHLIFNQYLEDTPLFLNTHGLSLTRQGSFDIEKVGKLVQGGNLWLAGQLLAESPPVDGVYRINLYFKAGKAGPSTDPMRFHSDPGRIDPFVMDSVGELIRLLQDFFGQNRDGDVTAPYMPPAPPSSGPGAGQLG